MRFADLGWTEALEAAFRPHRERGLRRALVSRDFGVSYAVLTEDGQESEAILSGRLWHASATDADLPSVGDWVAVAAEPGAADLVIQDLLPRRSCFSRKVPGKSSEQQVVAANVDYVVLITDVGVDLNPRRIERYLLLTARSGARPVLVLNKIDLAAPAEVDRRRAAVEALAGEVPVLPVSALRGDGLERLRSYFAAGRASTLVGSSGVGKSTLVNALLQAHQRIGDVNALTGKGRHTTTARRAFPIPGGGLLIDNPGMRELQLWTDEESLRASFRDIEELAGQCRFADCRHRSDAGCRVQEAMRTGFLDEQRYRNYLGLEAEIERLRRRRKKRQMRLDREARSAGRNRSRTRRAPPDDGEAD